jgi:hypothetical protein
MAAVLAELYLRMKDEPAPVDLDALWRELGVRREAAGVRLDDGASLAAARRAITGSHPETAPPGGTR